MRVDASSPALPHLAILLGALALVFANTLGNGFHLDDFYRVVDNPGVTRFWPPWRHFVDPETSSTLPRIVQFRPLLPLTLSVNHALAGHSLVGYHLGNLLFHLLASLFVYLVALELFAAGRRGDGAETAESPDRLLALFAALMFAVHPVSGITVNYICSRDLGLVQMFMFGAFWGYLRQRRRGFTRLGVVAILLAYLGALLSKTNALMLPPLLLAFEAVVVRPWSPSGPPVRSSTRAATLLIAALIGSALLFIAYTKYVLEFSDSGNVIANTSAVQYAVHQLQHHVFHYLRNFIWPLPIRQAPLVPPVVWQQAVGALCIGACWLIAVLLWRKARVLVFCLFAYQILLLPTSSVVPLWAEVVAYRPYPSSPFLFVGLTMLAGRIRWGRILMVVLLAWFATASVLMNRTWRTEATLWRHSCSHGGEALAHHNLAMALPSRTGAEQAVRRRELERALELKPGYILAHINLGLLQIDTLAVDAGLARIQAAVEFNRELPQSWYWLARANFGQQRWADAAVAAVQAATRQPGALDYQYTAGRYLQFADRVAESIPFLRRVAAIDPDYSDTRYLLGYALQTVGQRAAAIALYEEFVAQRADHDRAFFNLGLARMQDADWGRAIAAFTACLASNPANHKAHLRLAECYRSSGDAAQAARHQAIYDQSK